MKVINKHKYILLVLVLLMSPLTGATIDIYTPAMPLVSKYFTTDKSMVQLSITLYLIGYAVGQIVVGVLADAIGRKPVILVCLFLYMVTTLVCTFSNSIYYFLLFRFLQGIFVSGPGVLNKAYILDVFPKDKAQRYMNYVTIAWAIGPILAPVLGGYLIEIFSWKSVFYFLIAYSLPVFSLFLFMPETLSKKTPLSLKRMAGNFGLLFKDKKYVAAVLCIAIIYSFVIAFNLFVPFIVISTLHYPPSFYGKIALFLGVSWLAGNLLSRVVENINLASFLIKSFSFLSLIICIVGLLINLYTDSVVALVLPAVLSIGLMSFSFPKLYGYSVRMFPHIAALAGAVMGSCFVLVTGIISIVFTGIATTAVSLYVTYAVLSIICLIVYMALIKNMEIKPSEV
jgi:MFS transporter, DHA1 family, multidrug resistance protein